MRIAFVAIIAAWLAGCSDHASDDGCWYHGRHFAIGEHFQELCNDDQCTSQGILSTAVYCQQPIDANPSSCTPSPGCTGFGPQCGTYCCNAGERCVDGTCMCGNQPGCGDTDECGGPAMQSGCGETCCGGTGACPL
jgi:hypothetical protein